MTKTPLSLSLPQINPLIKLTNSPSLNSLVKLRLRFQGLQHGITDFEITKLPFRQIPNYILNNALEINKIFLKNNNNCNNIF